MTSLPQIDHQGPTPIYQQLVDWMRGQILTEQWPRGYQLTPEEELVTVLGVSRGTIRKAIEKLVSDGLLVRVHGRGTFVSSQLVEQPLAEQLITFSEDLIARGIAFETLVLGQRYIQPDARVADVLQVLPEEQVLHLHRVRVVDGEPVIVLDNYVYCSYCDGIDQVDFTRYRLFETLEETYGVHLVSGRRIFEARLAEGRIAELLKLEERSPVMYMEQVTSLADGTPVEFSNLWLRADRYRISANVSRQSVTQKTTRLEA
ncbi:MAG: GntR family transcriptional regulator [Anaerolineales bacterium]|nr:GntR family transcriptional regulator [Anaerolineales bacterium]